LIGQERGLRDILDDPASLVDGLVRQLVVLARR
jgi:hypothetical protein